MRKHKADKAIALIVVILMLVSLVVIYAIGGRVATATNVATGKNFSDNYFLIHHAAVIGLSVAAMLIAYKIPYKLLEKYSKTLFWVSIVLCLMVTIMGRLGSGMITCDKGACRAFYVPIISVGFAPVELLKISIALYGSYLVKSRKDSGELGTRKFWIPYATMFLLTVICVGGFQKDFGSTVVISAMLVTMAFVGGVPMRYLALAGVVLALAALFLIFTADHRIARIMGWEGSGDSYHLESSLISFGTGGFLGLGLGNSIQASGYLPESLSDSIFSIIGETWGWIGASLIIIAFVVLLLRILRVSQLAQNGEQSIFAASVFAWIVSHVIINVGGMIGIIPMKGITLPFLSYGGTSMIFAAFAIGVVIQISGWTKRKNTDEDSSSRWGQRRTRHASSSRRS